MYAVSYGFAGYLNSNYITNLFPSSATYINLSGYIWNKNTNNMVDIYGSSIGPVIGSLQDRSFIAYL